MGAQQHGCTVEHGSPNTDRCCDALYGLQSSTSLNNMPQAFLYYACHKHRCWFLSYTYDAATNTYPQDAFLKQLGKHDSAWLLLAWHRLGFDGPSRLPFFRSLACDVHILANTVKEYEELQQAILKAACSNVKAVHFNQNATLDERLYAPPLSASAACRPFDLIQVAAFAPYKRAHLACLVPNRARIGYVPGCKSHIAAIPESAYPTVYATTDGSKQINRGELVLNEVKLDGCSTVGRKGRMYWWFEQQEVAAALHTAQVGGIFSMCEGACYASTEYLLAGLPVVSSYPCTGGRKVWYTHSNSVLVQEPATSGAVLSAVRTALDKLGAGEFNRADIRNAAIEMARMHRQRLTEAARAWFAPRVDG